MEQGGNFPTGTRIFFEKASWISSDMIFLLPSIGSMNTKESIYSIYMQPWTDNISAFPTLSWTRHTLWPPWIGHQLPNTCLYQGKYTQQSQLDSTVIIPAFYRLTFNGVTLHLPKVAIPMDYSPNRSICLELTFNGIIVASTTWDTKFDVWETWFKLWMLVLWIKYIGKDKWYWSAYISVPVFIDPAI